MSPSHWMNSTCQQDKYCTPSHSKCLWRCYICPRCSSSSCWQSTCRAHCLRFRTFQLGMTCKMSGPPRPDMFLECKHLRHCICLWPWVCISRLSPSRWMNSTCRQDKDCIRSHSRCLWRYYICPRCSSSSCWQSMCRAHCLRFHTFQVGMICMMFGPLDPDMIPAHNSAWLCRRCMFLWRRARTARWC